MPVSLTYKLLEIELRPKVWLLANFPDLAQVRSRKLDSYPSQLNAVYYGKCSNEMTANSASPPDTPLLLPGGKCSWWSGFLVSGQITDISPSATSVPGMALGGGASTSLAKVSFRSILHLEVPPDASAN